MKRVLFVAAVVVLLAAVPSFAAAGAKPAARSASAVCDVPGGNATLTWSPAVVWPPNHAMRDITITYTDPDASDLGVLSVNIDSITQYPAPGNTSDAQGAPSIGTPVVDLDPNKTATAEARPVKLRAERDAHDMDGRMYVIGVTCIHTEFVKALNICIAVPHDRHHAAKVPDGVTCATR